MSLSVRIKSNESENEKRNNKDLLHRIRVKVSAGLRRGTWSESANSLQDNIDTNARQSTQQNRIIRQSDYYYRPYPYRQPAQPYYPYDDSEDLQPSYYDRNPYYNNYSPYNYQPYYRPTTTTTTTTTTTPNPLSPIGYMLIDTYHSPGGGSYSQPIAYYKAN